MSLEYVNPSGLKHHGEKILETVYKKIDGLEKELTKSEYEALSEEEKNNGTTYYVTDENETDNTIICRTSVADIPLTTRTISDSIFKDGEGSYEYYVKNGICTIFLGGQTLDLSNNIVNAMWGRVPIPVSKHNYFMFTPFGSGSEGAIWIDPQGNFRFNCYASTKENPIGQFTGYFSYPVLETE